MWQLLEQAVIDALQVASTPFIFVYGLMVPRGVKSPVSLRQMLIDMGMCLAVDTSPGTFAARETREVSLNALPVVHATSSFRLLSLRRAVMWQAQA
jgi:hypothetical protein